VNAVFSRLWNLGEDSGDELENFEALAFGMGKQRVVMGAFALVEQKSWNRASNECVRG